MSTAARSFARGRSCRPAGSGRAGRGVRLLLSPKPAERLPARTLGHGPSRDRRGLRAGATGAFRASLRELEAPVLRPFNGRGPSSHEPFACRVDPYPLGAGATAPPLPPRPGSPPTVLSRTVGRREGFPLPVRDLTPAAGYREPETRPQRRTSRFVGIGGRRSSGTAGTSAGPPRRSLAGPPVPARLAGEEGGTSHPAGPGCSGEEGGGVHPPTTAHAPRNAGHAPKAASPAPGTWGRGSPPCQDRSWE